MTGIAFGGENQPVNASKELHLILLATVQRVVATLVHFVKGRRGFDHVAEDCRVPAHG